MIRVIHKYSLTIVNKQITQILTEGRRRLAGGEECSDDKVRPQGSVGEGEARPVCVGGGPAGGYGSIGVVGEEAIWEVCGGWIRARPACR